MDFADSVSPEDMNEWAKAMGQDNEEDAETDDQRHHGTDEHAERGHHQNGAKLGHLGTDGRLQKINGIVAYPDKQVEHGKKQQKKDDAQINDTH